MQAIRSALFAQTVFNPLIIVVNADLFLLPRKTQFVSIVAEPGTSPVHPADGFMDCRKSFVVIGTYYCDLFSSVGMKIGNLHTS